MSYFEDSSNIDNELPRSRRMGKKKKIRKYSDRENDSSPLKKFNKPDKYRNYLDMEDYNEDLHTEGDS